MCNLEFCDLKFLFTFLLFSWIVSFPCHEKSFYINKKDEDKKSVSQ